MLRWSGIVALGCASLALGALTPWVMSGQDTTQDSALLVQQAAPPEPGLPIAAAAAAPRQGVQGVIAFGDDAMTDARECLSERGVTVYPMKMSSAEDLLTVLEEAAGDHAAVFIHVGTETGIVDGQILKALELMGPSQRIVWATIQIPDPEWGGLLFRGAHQCLDSQRGGAAGGGAGHGLERRERKPSRMDA